MSRALPEPGHERWQPLRAGLVDVFYYDREEFWFRDGRLLLRGNNGTGKSKVLALMLPFLLDGEIAPHRVEPDKDSKKRMEWNLLLGGEHPHSERLGYTWLEFGRRESDGTSKYCTIGCGLKAVSGRGIASSWFFVTSRRVGAGLALTDGAGIALTRDRLEHELGSDGAVHRTAKAHRRAVDAALFGLGEQRYAKLVELLIEIRAPQLSKRPSERALSAALTQALAPLDQALIADVAEAFRSLEEDRDALSAMVEARDASRDYLKTYRRYAQIACRRRAALPRQAQTAYDRVSRERAEAQAAHERARDELAQADCLLHELQAADARLRAREQALRDSPEARSARDLASAQSDARAASEHAGEAGEQQRRADDRVALARTRGSEAQARREAAIVEVTAARRACGEAAEAAFLLDEFRERVDAAIGATPEAAEAAFLLDEFRERVDAAIGATPEAVDALRSRAAALVERQAQAVAHLRRLLDALDATRREVAAARRRLEELTSQHDAAGERRATRLAALTEASAALVRDARVYLAATAELELDDPEPAVCALQLWAQTIDGANPLRAAVQAAGRQAANRLAQARADARAQRAEIEAQTAQLDAAIRRLQDGEDDAPPVPHTRSPDGRRGRPGAPFWQLVDFRDEAGPDVRAGYEAALEAAGILDAWVAPDGTLLDATNDDVVLAHEAGTEFAGPRLNAVLRVAVDREDPLAAAVSDAAVHSVLRAIGSDASAGGTAWVASNGTFRNGALRGRWHKPVASFIGRGAREAARRARLDALRREHEGLQQRLAAVGTEDERIDAAQARLDAELADMPDDEPLRNAHAALVAIEEELGLLAGSVGGARSRLERATEVAAAAELTAHESAVDLRLPSDPGELDAVSESLGALRTGLAALWPALVAHADAALAAERSQLELQGAEAEAAEQRERVRRMDEQAIALGERHRVLAANVGAAVAELEQGLAAVGDELRGNAADRRAAGERRDAAQREEGREAGRLEQLVEAVELATSQRQAAVASLWRFASTGLVAVALPELAVPQAPEEQTATAALRLARQIDQELAEVADDDHAWSRAERRASDEIAALADCLRRHGNNAAARMEESGIVVEVVFRGRATDVAALADALTLEVDERERLLDEREREILENHLIDEVASSLQELISAAEAQVLGMNRELADRPTSTGMRLRMLWRPREDGPEGLGVARERLLRQRADAWSGEDRSAVGTFLQAQIRVVRARDGAGTWLEHLTEALDYRSWHRFEIQRHQAGQWRSATGPASGGERVLAASMPLFAAASSHYASAGNPHAPRLVLLDEAFAGVDDDSRAKCLGLLTAFDLDVVMTSEREWGCYPEVPGLGIAQLSRVDGIAAVLVTHWEWDGAARVQLPRPDPGALVSAAAVPHSAQEQDGLWPAALTAD